MIEKTLHFVLCCVSEKSAKWREIIYTRQFLCVYNLFHIILVFLSIAFLSSLSLSPLTLSFSLTLFFLFFFFCVFFQFFFSSLLYSKFNTSATHKLWQRHFSVTSKQPRMHCSYSRDAEEGWYQEFLEDCKKKKDAWSDPALSLCLTKVNQVKYTISVCLSLTWLFYYKIIQERGSKNAVLVCVYAAT